MALTMNWCEVGQNRRPKFTLRHYVVNIEATFNGLAADPTLAIVTSQDWLSQFGWNLELWRGGTDIPGKIWATVQFAKFLVPTERERHVGV